MPNWTDDEGRCRCENAARVGPHGLGGPGCFFEETVGARRLEDAAAVARFGPGLTRKDVREVLAQARYDRPCSFAAPQHKRALKLEREGLLERDPTAPRIFRCTTLGEAVLHAYTQKGWLDP